MTKAKQVSKVTTNTLAKVAPAKVAPVKASSTKVAPKAAAKPVTKVARKPAAKPAPKIAAPKSKVAPDKEIGRAHV